MLFLTDAISMCLYFNEEILMLILKDKDRLDWFVELVESSSLESAMESYCNCNECHCIEHTIDNDLVLKSGDKLHVLVFEKSEDDDYCSVWNPLYSTMSSVLIEREEGFFLTDGKNIFQQLNITQSTELVNVDIVREKITNL